MRLQLKHQLLTRMDTF